LKIAADQAIAGVPIIDEWRRHDNDRYPFAWFGGENDWNTPETADLTPVELIAVELTPAELSVHASGATCAESANSAANRHPSDSTLELPSDLCRQPSDRHGSLTLAPIVRVDRSIGISVADDSRDAYRKVEFSLGWRRGYQPPRQRESDNRSQK
jgi:hypothetical protein